MKSHVQALTLRETLLPRSGILMDLGLILGFSLITALFARLAFYVGPVPITGQTFAVLLAGALLGSRRGALSQIAYLAEGAAGLPVFAGGQAGSIYMLGPTGGYLLGFVGAAFVVGLLTERRWDRHFLTTAVAMALGSAVLYLVGLFWLARFVPQEKLLALGLYPFLLGDLAKLLLAAALLPSAWSVLSRFSR